ncbi:helix-turn-helix transcriptional regulator [Kineococcus sp. SYSU DK005]|uniref:helix-turn-helix transcriptional regulator n=1 Tax=Kineococcus sp. SYSU DK005 TaxID=3383126 RepID=UPI003D7DA6F6
MRTVGRWRLVHALGTELLEVPDPEEQVLTGVRSLLRLVPGDVAADAVIDTAGTPRITEVPDLLVPFARDQPPEVFLSSPVLPHVARHGSLPASRVEDLCTPREWDRNPMRRLLLEPNGVPHALLTAHVTAEGVTHCWGVNRGRPFDDDERDALRAFEPFLRRAAHDRARTALVLDLDRAVSSGAGLVLFRQDDVVHLNDAAGALLERHRVPLATVLRLSRSALSASQRTGALPTRHGVLQLRWRPALPGSTAVVLTEAAGAGAAPAVVSPRQHAVLCHLSHGLTAAAIAHHLGISERTVHKHLENLYRALGVGDRLNAVLRGRDLGLLPVLEGCARLTRPGAPARP